jgi:imidazolonepropionase-like amidohydrolase
VTSDAAEILGVSDRVGSLEEGKDADLVVLDGEPLNSLSRVEMVFSDGMAVWVQKR